MTILANILGSLFESLCVCLSVLFILKLINKSENSGNKKSHFIKLWLIIFSVSLINYFIHILMPNMKWLKPVIFVPMVSLGIFFICKVKLYKGLITSILCLVTSAILEVILLIILKATNLSLINIVTSPYYNILLGCGISLAELLVCFAVYKFSTSLAHVDNKLKYFMPQLIAVVICMFPSMILIIINYYKFSALFIFINLLQLLVVAFVGMYNLKFVARHEDTEVELANTIIYNQTLKKVNEGARAFKHDMGNIVQAILGYIAINDSEGAKKYCQNLVIGFNDINILSILSPQVINDPAIYGVVVNKILLARDKNMTLSLDVNLDVSEINFPKFELSRMLGILIDNAIEAGEQTEAKKLIVNMRHDFERNKDIIVISNSIKDTNIDVHKIFNKNYSTKSKPSGFGLYEVNKFLKNNPQAYITPSLDKENMLFTQTLVISSKPQIATFSNVNIKESTVA